ncbi:MAG: hypothetical protein MI749_16515, partial [Desulfovibrionales bacterium]|nr:hypothetical protein [Desulfovibrionales bacterium]
GRHGDAKNYPFILNKQPSDFPPEGCFIFTNVVSIQFIDRKGSLAALPKYSSNVLARVIKSFEDSKGTFSKVPLAAGGHLLQQPLTHKLNIPP